MLRFAGHLVGLEIGRNQKGVVIEHLFEVRNQPPGVRRITVKASSQLVVHPTRCHLLERELRHLECIIIVVGVMEAKQQRDRARRGKLGRGCEPAVARIETPGELANRVAQEIR